MGYQKSPTLSSNNYKKKAVVEGSGSYCGSPALSSNVSKKNTNVGGGGSRNYGGSHGFSSNNYRKNGTVRGFGSFRGHVGSKSMGSAGGSRETDHPIMEMIKFYFELIYPGDSEARVLEIKGLCKELVYEYQSKTSQSAYGVQDNIGSSSASSMEVDENLPAWEKHILRSNKRSQSAVKMELERIYREGLEPRSQDFDILLWWMLRADNASGRLISPHRSRLHPNTIEALMCAQSWLWEIVNNGKPFTSDNHASIFYDYDTDVEAAILPTATSEILVRVGEW
ncbi:zinc finger BED domain-containing protein DAYSLEEPER-like protein [Tanacetum coccineum]